MQTLLIQQADFFYYLTAQFTLYAVGFLLFIKTCNLMSVMLASKTLPIHFITFN